MAHALSIATPSKLILTGNSEHAWKSFKQRFELHVLASGFSNKNEEEKVALLLTVGGDDLIEIYNSFEFPEQGGGTPNAATTLDLVVQKCKAYYSPRSNESTNRYKFRKCIQRSGESLDAFITRLKIIVKECDYAEGKTNKYAIRLCLGVVKIRYAISSSGKQCSPYNKQFTYAQHIKRLRSI